MIVERSTEPRWSRFSKWAGTWLGAFAWFADQQIVSMTVYANCPPRTHALAVACIAILAIVFGTTAGVILRCEH
jgi:hypothetical protein